MAEHDFHHSKRTLLARADTQRGMDRFSMHSREEVLAFLEGGFILDQNAVECLGVGYVEDWFL